MLPKLFLVASIYVGTMSFHFRNIFQWESFHRHRQRHRHRCPTGILKIDWNSEKYFFLIFLKKIDFVFKTYIKEYVLGLIFMIFKIIFLIFFNFLRIFEKKYPIFLKSMTKIAPFPQPNFSIWLRFLTIFHQPWTPGPWWKIAKSVIFCSSWPVETVLSKFSKNLFFDKLEFSLNIAVLMHPNGPKCLKND